MELIAFIVGPGSVPDVRVDPKNRTTHARLRSHNHVEATDVGERNR